MMVASPYFVRLPNDGRYVNLNHVTYITKNEAMRIVVLELANGKSIHWKPPESCIDLDRAIESIL